MTGVNPFKDDIDKDFEKLVFDIKYDKEQFKDSETIGLLLYRLAKEREKTNYLYEQILKRLDEISRSLTTQPVRESAPQAGVLSDIDMKILDFVKKTGKVDARTVQEKFGYKGQNAASARLNGLFKAGLLKKGRAGKKVLYWAEG
ncbi:hypothetical protein DRN74_02880 [Candidatus Micrarchaeota archaeon]|nr:MAG: hypothetical protein DRN74_02880 [Candidatus Micrarchaeota archaeon]